MRPRTIGLCGWFANDGRVASPGLTETLAAGLHARRVGQLDGQGYGLAETGGTLGRVDDNLLIAILGRPRWHSPDLQGLQEQQGPLVAIATAYAKDGPGLLNLLQGDFCLAIYDEQSRKGMLAVDRFGRWPLFWARQNDSLIFGSSADNVRAHPQLDAPISNQGIYHYLFFHMIPAPASIYSQIEKLPAGHFLSFEQEGFDIQCYWQPPFSEQPLQNETEMAERLLDTLSEAVKQEARPNCGAFLSGGLDSSTVAGMLARAQPDEADTYSIGFDAEGYDEMGYARIAAQHFGNRPHEYYVTPDDVVEALPLIAAAYDEPFGNSSALPAYFCARMAAEDGKQLLLAGDGGDELFAGNARYAKQAMFEHYEHLPGWLRSKLVEPLLGLLPGQLPLISKARSYIAQANTPLPDRLQSYNFICRLGQEGMFNPDFLASVDTELPLRFDRELYQRPETASTLNRMLYLDWQHTLADNDLRKVNRMCHLAGIEVAYPMLNDDLVSLSCRIPSTLKMKGNHLRHFYKQALKDFLPQEIINKRKQGFGLPFGVWMAEHPGLQELAADSLSKLRQRSILKLSFLDEVLRLHREGHAAYYGELVWILVMLELWLDSHDH